VFFYTHSKQLECRPNSDEQAAFTYVTVVVFAGSGIFALPFGCLVFLSARIYILPTAINFFQHIQIQVF